VVTAATAQPLLPTWARRLLRALGVRHFLKVDRLAIR